MSSSTNKSLNMNSVNHGRLSQRFDLIRKLGQGTYGKVQLGINKLTGIEVALKTIKKSKIESSSDLLRIKREISIMTCCNHPNIIHIYEVYENKEKIILVMEYAQGGELYDYLNAKKKLEEDEAKRIFSQISSAIYYCHKHSIVHRDLKLENILLDENNNAKIADFGLSNVCGDQLLKTFCGSPLYASPEIVRGIPYHGPEVDCWSLGVLLYTLVYGSMPFDGTHFKKLVKQITSGSFYEPNFKSGASELIKSLLTVDSKRRLNIAQVVSHPWLQSTECKSISEEYCVLAPVKGEFLVGINKSDTLDEVSEISSTSVEESEGLKVSKTKTKPPRKGVKTATAGAVAEKTEESSAIKPKEVKEGEVKPVKPIRNDKAKTEESAKTEVSEPKLKSEPTTKPPPTQSESPKTDKVKIDKVKSDKESQKVIEPPPKSDTKDSPNEFKGVEPPKSPKVGKVSEISTKNESVQKVAEVVKDGGIKNEKVEVKNEKVEVKNEKLEKEVSKPPEPVKKETPKITDEKTTKPEAKVVKSAQMEEKRTNEVKDKSKVNKVDTKSNESKQKSPSKETPAPAATTMTTTISSVPTAPAAAVSATNKVDEPEAVVPAVVYRNQRSTSTPTSEEPSTPTTPVPLRTERRNSKVISPKTAELIQNLTTDAGKGDPKKGVLLPPSKLSDIKKKFENGQAPKNDETGIGIILKRRKSIVDSIGGEGPEKPEPIPIVNHVTHPLSKPTTVQQSIREELKVTSPPSSLTSGGGSKVLNLVIEREPPAPPSQGLISQVTPPSARPTLKLVMPKPTPKGLTQPPVSASPPITKQGAAKKIGSLITKAKSNETTSSSGSRERIIPIQFDDELGTPVSRSGTGGNSGPPSRTGSISISILSGDPPSRADSRSFASLGSPASTISSPSYSRHSSFGNGIQTNGGSGSGGGGCQIMKSKREFIIPITIEERDDGGDSSTTTTSNTSASDFLTRRNSSTATASSSGASSSSRVYSTKRHTSSNLSLLSPDSTDLDDDFFDDDDFLSSDALFSSLLQRVRGLRLGDRLQDPKKCRGNGRWTTLELKRK